MGNVEPITVSVKKASEMVGLSAWTIKKLCDTRAIISVYSGSRRLVDVASLTAYIKDLPTERPVGESA